PVAPLQCNPGLRTNCPKSSDGVSRCLAITQPICVTTCPSSSDCPAQCKQQGAKGFCGSGSTPCICSNLDAG
ncbi:hypothetical protein LZ30DRAFT_553119, partial [Colletotrichum cereale]